MNVDAFDGYQVYLDFTLLLEGLLKATGTKI